MLDKELTIHGWHAAWLNRTLPAFELYANGITNLLLFCMCSLGLYCFFRLRSYGRQLKSNPSERAAIFAQLDKTVLKLCRNHWAISIIFLLNAIAISGVDAYIGIVAIKDDVSKDPLDYDKSFIFEAVAYCAYITVVFLTAFLAVPLLQMLVVTSVLAKYMRKHGLTTLSRFTLEARMYSTHIALIWTIVLFFLMAWWEPSESAGLTRWITLQAAMGSSFAWLDASFAFNFCYDKLADKDFKLGDGRVTDVVRMFAGTMKAAHTSEKTADVLPRYVSGEDAAANEKTPLTVER